MKKSKLQVHFMVSKDSKSEIVEFSGIGTTASQIEAHLRERYGSIYKWWI